MRPVTRRKLTIFLLVYLVLWGLTWGLGEVQINSRFDREFAAGTAGISPCPEYPLEKTRRIRQFDVSRPDGGLAGHYPTLPWKYRSRAFAIAPFVLVDKCAYQTGGLCGWGGIRLHVWFFGLTHWWPVNAYWVS